MFLHLVLCYSLYPWTNLWTNKTYRPYKNSFWLSQQCWLRFLNMLQYLVPVVDGVITDMLSVALVFVFKEKKVQTACKKNLKGLTVLPSFSGL